MKHHTQGAASRSEVRTDSIEKEEMLKQVSQLADPERCVAAANSLWIQASRSVEMQTEIGKTQAIDYAIQYGK